MAATDAPLSVTASASPRETLKRLTTALIQIVACTGSEATAMRTQIFPPVATRPRGGAHEGEGRGGEGDADDPDRTRTDPVDHHAHQHRKHCVDQGCDGQPHRHLGTRPAECLLDRRVIGAQPVDVDDARRIAERRGQRQREMAAPFTDGGPSRNTHTLLPAISHPYPCRFGPEERAPL